MSVTQLNRVFIARLSGTSVFDPNGDLVGKVRDAVATLRTNNQPPRILDRSITLQESGEAVVVEDMAMEQTRSGDWYITRVHVMKKVRGLRRKGATSTVQWEDVTGFALPEHNQGITHLLSTISNLREADLAAVIQDLAPKRRLEVARGLDDD
jgi:hypothetical protein